MSDATSTESDPTTIINRRTSGLAAAAVAAAALIALSACGGQDQAAAEPKIIVVPAPAPAQAQPDTTEAPTTTQDLTTTATTPPRPRRGTPAPAVDIDINVNGSDQGVPAPMPPHDEDSSRIPPGIIEDGVHVGYLMSQGQGWFSFDRADVEADGTWTNVNAKVRTLPFANTLAAANGAPVEVVVQNQHVVAVAPSSVAPSADPWRIAPGIIEDGVHVGYVIDYGADWISFDRADVAADGSWTNGNTKVRTMPWSHDIVQMWSGMAVEVHVENQHVVAVWAR